MRNWVLLLFTVLAFSSYGQNFPSEREKFIKYFEKSLSQFIVKEQKDFIKDELEPMLLKTTDFSDSYFKRMVETCNTMETKRLKYFPDIYNYVFTVYSFVKNKQSASSFSAWHSSVDKLLDAKNINKFTDFIELSAGFFSKRMLADNSNASWYYRGGSYSFEFEDKPMIVFESGNLVSVVENIDKRDKNKPNVDSIVIYEASGKYDPISKKWMGQGGKLTWEKVGLPAEETFAELTKYEMSLKSSNLVCDTVSLTTPYFVAPIKGKISDRAFRITREEDKIYPQFLSFEKRLKIKELYPNMDYEGGFSLQGKNFVGVGGVNQPCIISVKRNSKTFIKLQSQLMIINKEKLNSNLCVSTIYVGAKDSIYHPGLEFNYQVKDNLFDFVRGTSGISQAPFTNSIHQLDMYIPRLSWKYDDQKINLTYSFGASIDKKYARLESKNYFDIKLYEGLGGLDTKNPLQSIYDYCYKYDEYYVNEGKIATALGKTIEQCKPLILDLASLGFLNYDSESKMVTVTQKLITFVKSRGGKMDYDNLIFNSDFRPKTLKGYTEEQIAKEPYLKKLKEEYDKKNSYRRALENFAVLDLGTLELDVEAVDMVTISEAQNTHVFPRDGRVVIKENRDFTFDGWIISGKLEINSLEANYVYAANKINLFKTDKTNFRVKPLKPEDGKESITMVNQIDGIVGELFVDSTNNRSGISKKITTFPKLKVTKPTQIYYNHESVYKGAYDSTRFYYTLDPFILDSLDNFKESHQRFKGELTSAGIFPKIREDVKIMSDYSFGFSKVAEKPGYKFYDTQAKYDNKIILSAQGLQGAGKIEFLHSVSNTKPNTLYTFLPDSTLGFVEFTNKQVEQGIQYPEISSPDAFITFVPKKNQMKVNSTPTQELNMFNKEARLKGGAVITPEGCTGFGVVTFKDANLGAKLLKFKAWDIDSDTANFNLKNNFKVDDEDPLALKTENLNAHVSFKDRLGQFKSNAGTSRVEFPVNQYLCKMDFFTWFMDKEEIELATKETADLNIKTDLDLVGANFFSLHPEQDSLRFRSREARYSLREKTIFCRKIDYIEIADAQIYPDSGKVTVRKKAKMDQLKNSKIVANSVTKYHRFINCNTDIYARRKYEAEGDYPYYDADSAMTILKIKSIKVDSTFQTVGVGKIPENQGFKLSPQFEYNGNVRINANQQFVNFSGATRIVHGCDKFKRSWMAFNSEIDPKNIQIPVSSEMKSLDSLSLTAGIVWRDSKKPEEVKMYPTFLSEMQDKGDQIVFTSSGFLTYNAFTSEFQIANKEKLVNRYAPGNFIALQTGNCSLYGDGKIKLGMDYGSSVSVDAVGTVSYYQETGQTSMNLTVKYNLPVDDKAFEKVANKINAGTDLKPLDFASTTIEKALLEWTDQKTADQLKADYSLNGFINKVPSNMKGAIVITGLKVSSFMNPKMEEKGIYSDVESAAIFSIFDKPVMKYIPVKAFFQQIYSGTGGDKFGLFFTNPGASDYFLSYSMDKKEGSLLIFTGDAELEGDINGLKADKRKSKEFSYEITTNRIYLSKFLKLFGSSDE